MSGMIWQAVPARLPLPAPTDLRPPSATVLSAGFHPLPGAYNRSHQS